MGEYVRVDWEDVLANDSVGTFVPLDSSQYWYGNFISFITDGQDFKVYHKFERMERDDSGLIGFYLGEYQESEVFRNQPGCRNGIDLGGNLIENVLLRVDYETRVSNETNRRTEHRLNFTVAFEGRPLGPHEDALAKVFVSTAWEDDEVFQNYTTFLLKVDEYTRVDWEDALVDSQSGKYVALDKFQPSYGSFISLMTDGNDLEVRPCLEEKGIGDGFIETTTYCFTGIPGESGRLVESDIFRNQTGCSNGIDLEGNLIKKVSLRVDGEHSFSSERNRTLARYNFTILFEGRLLEPFEDALAVLDFGTYGCFSGENFTLDLLTIEGPHWALQRHSANWNTIKENEPIPIAEEYGTGHSMHEMLTDGDDGYFHLDMGKIRVGWRESDLFDGEPGCYNGIDLEGSYVEEVALVFRTIDLGYCRQVSPRVVISGTLGEAPATATPCPTMESSALSVGSPWRWLLLSSVTLFGSFLLIASLDSM